tara:strand:+ start:159 stop:1028 length:870 start_codon:yes stop_codon:yes gene_type:complete
MAGKKYNNSEMAIRGRNGDTTVRDIDGQRAHVNAYEAHLRDTYGKDAEPIIKAMGSGTINPVTGEEEYFWPWIVAGAIVVDWGINTFTDDTGPISQGIAGALDWAHDAGTWLLPNDESGWFGSQQQHIDAQAEDIVDTGMEGLAADVQAYAGEGGFLDREFDIGMDRIDQDRAAYSLAGQNQLIGTRRTAESQKSKSGLATSGTIDSMTQEQEVAINRGYNQQVDATMTSMDELNLKSERDRTDYLRGIRNEMNELVLRYSEIADEAYGGSQGYDDLLALLEDDEVTGG